MIELDNVRLKNEVNIDYKDFGSRLYENVEELRRQMLYDIFSNFEDGIVEEIVDNTILRNISESNDFSDKNFIEEVKDALERFIIVDDDSEEDEKCMNMKAAGDLVFCEFDGFTISDKSLYYEI